MNEAGEEGKGGLLGDSLSKGVLLGVERKSSAEECTLRVSQDQRIPAQRKSSFRQKKHQHNSLPGDALLLLRLRKKSSVSSSRSEEFLLTTSKEGFLRVKEKGTKKWHRRWLALGDTLRCYKDVMVRCLSSESPSDSPDPV
jgi:hypothetical protein